MASFKPIVRGVRKDGMAQVYIRVTHGRKIAHIRTDKVVHQGMIDGNGEIKDPYVRKYCADRILEYCERLNRHETADWTVSEVVEFLTSGDTDVCFSDYARKYIDAIVDEGRPATASNYRMAITSLEKFMHNERIMCSHMTSTVVNRWIKSLDHSKNIKTAYPVRVRVMFRSAVSEYNDYDAGILRIKTDPWRNVEIPKVKRSDARKAISAEDCRVFFSYPARRQVALGRDVAKLILCLAGINTIDLYKMRKENYKGGVLRYCRSKTKGKRADNAYFEIRVEPLIQPVVEKYLAPADDPYLFTFHSRYNTSQKFCVTVREGIRRLCSEIGTDAYSPYTFRHTWGTIAQNDCGANIEEVAFGLNHYTHKVTRGYVRPDFSPVWELNRKVIDFVFFSNARSKQWSKTHVREAAPKKFRVTPASMIYARAYYCGELIGELSNIGFRDVQEVARAVAEKFQIMMPVGSLVQFRVKNVDSGVESVYEGAKGRDF